MPDYAISVSHISKMYKLYDKPSDRFREAMGFSRKVRYKEHFALNNVSFNIRRGETVGIIGTNGSGKSTILKIITGVLNPSGGTVTVNGRISALLELGAGFNMEYTGIENVYLNGTMIGFSREEIDSKLNDILEFADIGDFVRQPVKTYSSGMFVRLAFAIAINIDPEILIVDEALSVGDVFFQAKCYHKFEEFKRLGKTILFVSHDLGSIGKYCDRVILLNDGIKLDEGNPKEMVDIYKKLLVHQYVPEEEQEEPKDGQPDDTPAAPAAGSGLWKDRLSVNPHVIEYGNGQAQIYDYTVKDADGNFSNTIEKGSECEILFKVRFHARVQDPIFAITLKDLKGTEISGTNTMFERIDTGVVEAGEERIVSFKQRLDLQRLDLQGGDYLVSLGCTGYQESEFTVYHRLYDVVNITVVSQKNTVGFYDMNSKIVVAQGDGK